MSLNELKMAGIGYAAAFAVMLVLGGIVLLSGIILRRVEQGIDQKEKR